MAVAPLFALVALGLFDAALSGFRAFAGRSARIDKRRYYARALALGALSGCVLAAAVGAAAGLVGAYTSAPAEYLSALDATSARMTALFAPLAAALALLLAVRAVPSADARSLASTLVFGPITLLRPAILVCGCAWALGWPVRLDVAALVGSACAGLLLVERCLRAVDCLRE